MDGKGEGCSTNSSSGTAYETIFGSDPVETKALMKHVRQKHWRAALFAQLELKLQACLAAASGLEMVGTDAAELPGAGTLCHGLGKLCFPVTSQPQGTRSPCDLHLVLLRGNEITCSCC